MLSMLEIIMPMVAVILVIGPLWFLFNKGVNSKNAKSRLFAQICIFVGVFLVAIVAQFNNMAVLAQEAAAGADLITGTNAQGMGFIAAALATGFSALGAGIAVAAAAPAAIGAISENSENLSL